MSMEAAAAQTLGDAPMQPVEQLRAAREIVRLEAVALRNYRTA